MYKVEHKGKVLEFETEYAAKQYVRNYDSSGARPLGASKEPAPVQEKKTAVSAQPVDEKPKRGRKSKKVEKKELPQRSK